MDKLELKESTGGSIQVVGRTENTVKSKTEDQVLNANINADIK